MKLPAFTVPVLRIFQPAFSTPRSHRGLGLGLGAIGPTGRRTITTLCRPVRPDTQNPVASDHRVLSQRRWSAGELARRLLTLRLTSMVPMGPGVLAADDTVAAHPGSHVFGEGRHRDGRRSTHRSTAYRWVHQGVV
jgi:DDE superfamily endonuclease